MFKKLNFHFILITTLLFLFNQGGFSQEVITKKNASKAIIKLVKKADNFLLKGNQIKALKFLNKATTKEPNFIDGYLKSAAIHFDNKKYAQAIDFYKRALQVDEKYDPKIYNAISISNENLGNYQEAKTYLLKFRENSKSLKPETLDLIERKVEGFDFIMNAMENPVDFNPVPLSSKINSILYSEYLPSLTADEKYLYFTRVNGNQEDLYYSKKAEDGSWEEAKMMPNINTYENEGAHCISADGKTILYTYCSDGRTGNARGCNIYIAVKQNNKWSKPKYFEQINSKAWDAQPNISSDGKTILFTSRRAGGLGKSDLWWCKKEEDGKWGKVMNLGEVINTKGSEESPFLHPDGKTLYFKSDYHIGMGSFDLFKSILDENGAWSKPVNLGYPINTKDHEGAMIVSLNGKSAYYSRGSGKEFFDKKQSDIFTFDLPVVHAASPVGFVRINVKDSESKKPLEVDLEIQAAQNGNLSNKIYKSDNEGSVLVTLPLGKNYSLNINRTGYNFYSERFELEDVNTSETAFEIDVFLNKLEAVTVDTPEEAVVLKNVLFESASFVLKSESYFELEKLRALLATNDKINIEIRGHTDDVGDEDSNLLLSQQRAQSVMDYLIGKGISKSRITSRGFGESNPIASNESEEGRAINRRTEFVIIE